MNFSKFLTAPFLQNTSGRLLLNVNWNKTDIGQLRVDAVSQTDMFIQVDTVKKPIDRQSI